MTNEQFAVLIGVVYIAPHLRKDVGLFMGVILLCTASVMGY